MTKRPWHVVAIFNRRIVGDETARHFDALYIHGPNATVARVYRCEDARLIVDAVNAYDAGAAARDRILERNP